MEHPRDYFDRVEQDRKLVERRNALVRALRGATPPFSDNTERELRAVMQEQLRTQTEAGR